MRSGATTTDRTLDPLTAAATADAADGPLVLDGELMRAGEAMIPAGDDGLIRGDGAFDAFPVLDGRPFARAAHLDRLERSCRALALDCPREQLEALSYGANVTRPDSPRTVTR